MKEIIRHRDDELNIQKSRTDEKLAKKYQFKSRFTMRAAALVIEKGCIELIQAMDCGSISFKSAAKLALLPIPLQQELISQGERQLKIILNQKKKTLIKLILQKY